MGVRTYLTAGVPKGRLDEAWGYFEALLPKALIGETERPGTGVVWLGASVAGDWAAMLEDSIEKLGIDGIKFEVQVRQG